MNTKQKGDLAASKALAYYIQNEYEVLLPFGDKRPYDMVIEKDGILTKIQCKYTSYKRNNYEVDLRITGGNKSKNTCSYYTKNDFDLLFVVTSDGIMYEFPNEVWSKCKSAIKLCKKYDCYKINGK